MRSLDSKKLSIPTSSIPVEFVSRNYGYRTYKYLKNSKFLLTATKIVHLKSALKIKNS